MAIKIAFFDCDGTLTKVKNSWEYLHRRFNLWENGADRHQQRFHRGEIDYHQFCRLDSVLWRGIALADVLDVVNEIPCHAGSAETMGVLRKAGVVPVIVSTGLSLLVDRVARELGVGMFFANNLCQEGGVLTGHVQIHVNHEEKGAVVRGVLQRLNLGREDACAVGDGDGDQGMFEEVSLPIAFRPSGSIASAARHVVLGGSLLAVLDVIREHGPL